MAFNYPIFNIFSYTKISLHDKECLFVYKGNIDNYFRLSFEDC